MARVRFGDIVPIDPNFNDYARCRPLLCGRLMNENMVADFQWR